MALLVPAETVDSVNDLILLVRNAIRSKQSDGRLARILQKVRLTESLDGRAIEELESEGAGPRAVAEMDRLREASIRLPKPMQPLPFPTAPQPTVDEQKRVLDEARNIALNYTGTLPDFICTEVVRRYSDESGDWRQKDTLLLKLSYFEREEKYQLLRVNNHATSLPYDAIGGAITEGEFGSLLHEIFATRSGAQFDWDHWTTLRGRPAHVFRFQVNRAKSHYTMEVGIGLKRYGSVVGQHGLAYVDRDTNRIVRITAEADSIPSDFPVRSSATVLDYGFTSISGRQFLLPIRAVVRMGTIHFDTRNEVEFNAYQKYGADTSITFEDPVEDKPPKP